MPLNNHFATISIFIFFLIKNMKYLNSSVLMFIFDTKLIFSNIFLTSQPFHFYEAKFTICNVCCCPIAYGNILWYS